MCLMRRCMKEGVKAALAIAEKVGGKELCRQLRLAEVATYAERVRPQAGEALCEVIGGLLQMVAWPAGGGNASCLSRGSKRCSVRRGIC